MFGFLQSLSSLQQNFKPKQPLPQRLQEAFSSASQESSSASLDSIIDILVKEQSLSSSFGPCLELFLNNNMLSSIVNNSINKYSLDNSTSIQYQLQNTILFSSSIISLLHSSLLYHSSIHSPILSIINYALLYPKFSLHFDVLQLDLAICSRFVELPSLINVFFIKQSIPKSLSDLNIKISNHSFPLFDHILRFIHLDGSRGDFSREAAAILIQFATDDIADYVKNSEFAAISVAAVGGVFSQLPNFIPQGITWDGSRSNNPGKLQKKFRADLESFIRVLNFLQDIILQCPNEDISIAVLHEFHSTFLENIVQSSLACASDFDGSTAAILFYLNQMVTVFQEDSLVSILCKFLLCGDDSDENDLELKERILLKQERKRATAFAIPTSPISPVEDSGLHLFARDVLLSKLKSHSEDVVIATLNLFTGILTYHPSHALHYLFEKIPADLTKQMPMPLDISRHLNLLSRYSAMLPEIEPETPLNSALTKLGIIPTSETTFAAYINAAEQIHELHITEHLYSRADIQIAETTVSKSRSGSELVKLIASDPTLHKFVRILSDFFQHSYAFNLAVTGLITQIVSVHVPVLYTLLFAGDLIGHAEVCLYPILEGLQKEAAKTPRAVVSNMRIKMNSGGGPDFIKEEEHVKNVVLLEEFIKELVAVLVVHACQDYDMVVYG